MKYHLKHKLFITKKILLIALIKLLYFTLEQNILLAIRNGSKTCYAISTKRINVVLTFNKLRKD